MTSTIHGLTFTDYAATNAFLAQGKPIEELLPILGCELPQWEEASAHFENAMQNDTTFQLGVKLGEVFQNPAQGKYASEATQTTEDAVERIPDLETYTDIQMLMSVAGKYGVDPQAALAERGVTVMDFSQAGMKFHAEMSTKHADPGDEGREFREWYEGIQKAAEAKYEAYFQSQAGGALGDDIEF